MNSRLGYEDSRKLYNTYVDELGIMTQWFYTELEDGNHRCAGYYDSVSLYRIRRQEARTRRQDTWDRHIHAEDWGHISSRKTYTYIP